MRREITRETVMFTDLPLELESEILSRVPATSLYQLRSTCRRWYVLFKDPRFIKENSGKAATQVFLKKDFSVYSVSINLHGIIDPSLKFKGKLKSPKDEEQVMISNIFHCNGLLLCNTQDNRLVVWNPCTGQTRWIQPYNNHSTRYYNYVLGYEKSCDSYKILRYTCYTNGMDVRVVEIEIYDFNSDSWRALDDVDQHLRITSRGVYLKGNAYWVAYWVAWEDVKPLSNFFLLRFDFKRERFERLSLPFQSNCSYYLGFSLSVVREEKLSVLLETRDCDSLEMKIWVTDTINDEAKDTNIQYLLVVNFRKRMITSMMTVSFLVDEENKRVVCCRRDIENKETIIYIVGGDHNIHVCKQAPGEIAQRPYDYRPLLVSYVPKFGSNSACGGKCKR